MPDYRRAWHPGGTYFFTVNLLQRQGNDLLTRHIGALRETVSAVRQRHPFVIHGWTVLPDHLHCVIELPSGDADFATRWRLIKMGFSKAMPPLERRSPVRVKRGERGIWQRRYSEHLIRDEADFRAHMDYVHINPVMHGLARQARGRNNRRALRRMEIAAMFRTSRSLGLSVNIRANSWLKTRFPGCPAAIRGGAAC